MNLSERADSRLERADSRLERADFRPERADFRPKRGNFRPDRADFRPEKTLGGWTDGQTNKRTKVPLCSFGAAAQKVRIIQYFSKNHGISLGWRSSLRVHCLDKRRKKCTSKPGRHFNLKERAMVREFWLAEREAEAKK